MIDLEFKSHIISEICDYAVANNIEPDEALALIANDILCALELATFNAWKPNNGSLSEPKAHYPVWEGDFDNYG